MMESIQRHLSYGSRRLCLRVFYCNTQVFILQDFSWQSCRIWANIMHRRFWKSHIIASMCQSIPYIVKIYDGAWSDSCIIWMFFGGLEQILEMRNTRALCRILRTSLHERKGDKRRKTLNRTNSSARYPKRKRSFDRLFILPYGKSTTAPKRIAIVTG